MIIPPGSRYELERRIGECEKRQLDLARQLTAIEEAQKQANRQQDKLDGQLRMLAEQRPGAEANLKAFLDFLAREPESQQGRGKLNQIMQDLSSLKDNKELLVKSLEKLQLDMVVTNNKIIARENRQQEAEKKSIIYRDAPVSATVTGNIEELETRLKAITATGACRAIEKIPETIG